MRSASVIPVVLLAAAWGAGCRPLKGPPANAGAATGAPEEAAQPSGVRTRSVFTLGDGVRVVLEENHAAPVVAMQLWLTVGAADEPEGQEGAANVIRHLLRRSLRATGPAGIESRSGAWTSYDETVVHTLVATPFIEDGLRALAGAVTAPLMTAADFDAARAAARADLRATRADPPHVAAASALAAAFSAHPYRRALLGTDATLGELTVDKARAFYDGAYGPGQATLVVVGDFDAPAMRARVAALFGAWRPANGPATRAREPAQGEPRVVVSTADIADPELALAWKTPAFRDDDRAALQVLAAVLGQGARTRLDDELVRNRQLARSTRAFLYAARDGGLLVTSATLGAGPVDDTAAVVLEEVARLGRDGPTRDELSRARTLVERQEVGQKASVDGYARRLGLYATVAGDPDLEASHLKRLREVDGGQVQKAARLLRAANLTVAVTLPAARGPSARGRGDDRVSALAARLRATVAEAGARAPVTAAKAARGADVRNIETYRLPSGVRLLILPDDTADQVSVRAVWPGGARIEDAHLTGAASLIARLLVRGTKTRAPEQLAAELADVGGRLEGFAGLDVLGLRGEFLASRWEHGLDVLVDCLRNPRFAEEDVEQDRRVVLEAIRVRDNDAANVARRLFEDVVYAGRPYHEDALGTSESVAALTRRRLLDFFRAAYGPASLTIAIVGAVDPARVADRVQALFADAPPAPREGTPPPAALAVAAPLGKGGAAPAPTEPRQAVRFGAPGQARLVLGFPGVAPNDPDRLALDVIAEILGRPGQRLAALRDTRGLLEEVEARSTVGADGGTFAVRAAVRPDLLELAVAAVRGELARLLEAGVSPDELAGARQALIARRALAFQHRGSVALALALGTTLGDPTRSPRRDLDDLARLTPEDILRVARRFLDPRREVLAVVRPQEPRVSARAPGSTFVAQQ